MVEILKLMLNRDSEVEIWSRLVQELEIRTQPSGPMCLWQCFLQYLKNWKNCCYQKVQLYGEKIDSLGKNKSKVVEATMDFLHLLEILSKIIL